MILLCLRPLAAKHNGMELRDTLNGKVLRSDVELYSVKVDVGYIFKVMKKMKEGA